MSTRNPSARASFVCENCGRRFRLARVGRPKVQPFCNRKKCRDAAARARWRAAYHGRKLRPLDHKPELIRTVYRSNGEMIAAAARLYVPDDAVVADVTFGKGAFWSRGRKRFTVIGSDMRLLDGVAMVTDCRRLPYADHSFDYLMLDLPYVHTGPNGHYLDAHYGGHATTAGLNHKAIMRLRRDAMVEARRVLRPGGVLLVKTKDEVESGRQCWSHIELYLIARKLRLYAKDLFVLVAPVRRDRWYQQRHAHKDHSFLWVFTKR